MADETSALVPVEERSVDFYGDEVLAVLVEQGGEQYVYVPLRPIAEYLGLDWSAQTRRIRRDRVLAADVRFVARMATNPQGGNPNMLCLPLRLLPGWLFGITTSQVRPELQEKIDRYRRECFDVLWRAFQSEALTRREPSSNLAVLAQVRETALAVAQLAEQQMQMERRLDTVEARLDRAAEVVAGLQRRVQPAAAIGDEQAAEMLTAQDPGKNHYQGIFAELYRRFGVSSYKLIRTDQVQAVLQFLEDWRRAAGGN